MNTTRSGSRSGGTAETAKTAETIAEKMLVYVLCGLCVLGGSFRTLSAQPAGPVIVVETTKGTFEFETYPVEAPRTVAHIVDLVKRGFYDGQRIHRALPAFLVQWGDPRSRDLAREADWGRGPEASSGHPIGASELRRKRLHTRGAVAVAHQGIPALADSQIYVTLADRPDLNNRYTVFGHVIAGDEVPAQLERGDLIRKMYVKE
jgi:cyclophilin family peptidyl-prolyl cis-trans isomerase